MSQYLQWIILTALTGSPVLAAAIVLVGWWFVDRFTLQILPNPARWAARLMRVGRLRRTLQVNPHDRKARLDLAEVLVGQRRYKAALEILRPNIEAGDDDVGTCFTMGIACLGAGHATQGEAFLDSAEAADPNFRLGLILLERGRWRLRRKDYKGAREALEAYCAKSVHTVEGRVLLARAIEEAGDDATAAMKRHEAWVEFTKSPRFQRRHERFWAWRAKPSRPLTYALVLLMGLFLFAKFAAPTLAAAAEQMRNPYGYPDEEQE